MNYLTNYQNIESGGAGVAQSGSTSLDNTAASNLDVSPCTKAGYHGISEKSGPNGFPSNLKPTFEETDDGYFSSGASGRDTTS